MRTPTTGGGLRLYFSFLTHYNVKLYPSSSSRHPGSRCPDQTPERSLHRKERLCACRSDLRAVRLAREVVWGPEGTGGPVWEDGALPWRCGWQVGLLFLLLHVIKHVLDKWCMNIWQHGVATTGMCSTADCTFVLYRKGDLISYFFYWLIYLKVKTAVPSQIKYEDPLISHCPSPLVSDD